MERRWSSARFLAMIDNRMRRGKSAALRVMEICDIIRYMMKLRERLLKLAFCLVAAVVAMPAMALDGTAFALDQERLVLDLVLPDAAGAFPINANRYWEKVSRVEFTNILERISKMTQLTLAWMKKT